MFHHANPEWTKQERQEWMGNVRRVGESHATKCAEVLAIL